MPIPNLDVSLWFKETAFDAHQGLRRQPAMDALCGFKRQLLMHTSAPVTRIKTGTSTSSTNIKNTSCASTGFGSIKRWHQEGASTGSDIKRWHQEVTSRGRIKRAHQHQASTSRTHMVHQDSASTSMGCIKIAHQHQAGASTWRINAAHQHQDRATLRGLGADPAFAFEVLQKSRLDALRGATNQS